METSAAAAVDQVTTAASSSLTEFESNFLPRTKLAFQIGEVLEAMEEERIVARVFTSDLKNVQTEDEQLKTLIQELQTKLNSANPKKWGWALEVMLDPKHSSEGCKQFLSEFGNLMV